MGRESMSFTSESEADGIDSSEEASLYWERASEGSGVGRRIVKPISVLSRRLAKC